MAVEMTRDDLFGGCAERMKGVSFFAYCVVWCVYQENTSNSACMIPWVNAQA